MKTATPVRVGVVGCGWAGREVYVADLADCQYGTVVAVCDADGARAETTAEQYGISAAYDDVVEMLRAERLDILVNATPAGQHHAVTLLALRAGVHVYSEKPLTASLKEADELMAEARAADRHLICAPDVMLRPALRAVAERIGSGAVGEVQMAVVRYANGFDPRGQVTIPWYHLDGGGALTDMGSYAVAALTGTIGAVKTVSAFAVVDFPDREGPTGPLRATAEDNATVMVEFAGGGLGVIGTGFHQQQDTHLFQVAGTAGSLRLRGGDWSRCVVEEYSQGSWREVSQDQYEPDTGIRSTVRALAEGHAPQLTSEHALHVFGVIEAAKQSARTGLHVALETTSKENAC